MNLDDVFEQITQDALEDYKADLADDLADVLNSKEAQASADKINKLFAKDNQDSVADPKTISNQISETEDGLSIKLSEDQRRFMMADPIYGKDVMGLKYNQD